MKGPGFKHYKKEKLYRVRENLFKSREISSQGEHPKKKNGIKVRMCILFKDAFYLDSKNAGFIGAEYC